MRRASLLAPPLAALLVAFAAALAPPVAADVPNPPPECAGKGEGDSCSLQDGTEGTCQIEQGELTCIPDEESDDDGGCSTTPGAPSRSAAWLLLAAAGLMLTRRRR